MKLKTKFQDEDFGLGEVVEATISTTSLVDTHIKLKARAKRGGEHSFYFESLKELNELFEDYEEPKDYYFIRSESLTVGYSPISNNRSYRNRKEIGNYFETEEEAKKAVEKLKAWKRLKDKGFRFKDYTRKFDGFKRVDGSVFITAELDDEGVIGMIDELHICFGGEE